MPMTRDKMFIPVLNIQLNIRICRSLPKDGEQWSFPGSMAKATAGTNGECHVDAGHNIPKIELFTAIKPGSSKLWIPLVIKKRERKGSIGTYT